MNDLMTVGATQNANERMSSRQVAELTGKQHAHVMRDIRNLLEQGIDASNFGLVDYLDKKGEIRPEYQLTKKGCLILASGYDAVLREKIIDRWEELESQVKQALPQTYLEALKALVVSEEQKQLALLEAKEAKDNVKRLIHDNKTYTSGEIAKELGMRSANELNKKLSDLHVQFKQNGVWLLYAKYSDCGYVSIKQQELDNGRIIYDRRFTGKGRDFVIDILTKNNQE